MKKLLLMLCLIPLLGITSCDNDDDNSPDCQGIDCLPEATQTGAGTFGCLVNGEPFYAFGGVTCFYQLINGQYEFAVGFNRELGFPVGIAILSNAQSLSENSFVIESCENPNSICGNVIFISTNENFVFNETDIVNGGTLTITKFDNDIQIISGTFEFEILNPDDGEVYQITDGRFDSFYSL